MAAVGSVGATGGDGRRGLDMMSLSVCSSCIGRGSTFGFSSFVVLVSIVSISSLVIFFWFCEDFKFYLFQLREFQNWFDRFSFRNNQSFGKVFIKFNVT